MSGGSYRSFNGTACDKKIMIQYIFNLSREVNIYKTK